MKKLTREQIETIWTRRKLTGSMNMQLESFASKVQDEFCRLNGIGEQAAPLEPRTTDKWESCRVADYNRGWNDCLSGSGIVREAAPPAVPDGWRSVADDVASRVIKVLGDLALAPVLFNRVPESNSSIEYVDRDLVVNSIHQIRRAVGELSEYSRLSAARQPLTPEEADSLRGLPGWLALQATAWEAQGLPADHEDIRAVRKWAAAIRALLAAHDGGKDPA